MAKFILIDQSLRGIGGHPYDYALHLLRAAEEMRYEPILGTHRKFRGQTCLPAAWQVLSYFRHSTYSRHALYCSGGRLPRASRANSRSLGAASARERITSLWSRVSDAWHEHGRQRQLRHFSEACEKTFSRIRLEEGDHVVFATVSEFDLLGLANFLRTYPAGKVAQWHLQFHFDIFAGRPAEYPRQQDRLEWVRQCFQKALGQVSGMRLHFYNTSLPLVEQYDQLGVGIFKNLPYPINPAMQPCLSRSGSETSRPLRVTCGGGFRKEKGQQRLTEALAELWASCFASGEMQLQVQAKRSKWSTLRLPSLSAASSGAAQGGVSPAIVHVPHPLSMEKYVELIRQTHIGLMMYDSRRYYARRAGVLCELLCAGVPVIVPGGCWLSEQIAEAGFTYLDRLCMEAGADTTSFPKIRIDRPSVVGLGETIADLPVPDNAGDMIVSARPGRHTRSGAYLRLLVEQFDAWRQPVSQFAHVIGQRLEARPVRAMWRIDPQAAKIRLSCKNAYDDGPIDLEDVQVTWLERSETRPLSAVGLIAADEQHVGRSLREMANHYDHYRQTALEFSEPWGRLHDPRLTLAVLTGHSDGPIMAKHAARPSDMPVSMSGPTIMAGFDGRIYSPKTSLELELEGSPAIGAVKLAP